MRETTHTQQRPPGSRWLAKDLTALIQQQITHPDTVYDVVIVGSGYGGAMAAAELAGATDADGRQVSVCVLERGQEHVPGSFPASTAELFNHVRFTKGRATQPTGLRDALLDFRLGEDVCALVANGLGGGSLINAGVMVAPRREWGGQHHPRYPTTLKQALTPTLFEQVKERLGARDGTGDITIESYPCVSKSQPLTKTALLESLDKQQFRPPALSISMQNTDTLSKCTLCGDCLTGCNVGAKVSLDTSLLREAYQKGAELYTGASVLSVRRASDPTANGLWELQVVYTSKPLRERSEKVEGGSPLWLKARKVILAAGTLGSTEILMRSQSDQACPDLQFSSMLGHQFSCNGDNLAAIYKAQQPAHATSDEFTPSRERRVGPTITGSIDATTADGDDFSLQEFAVPGPLKRLFEEVLSTSATLYTMEDADTKDHEPATASHNRLDPCALDPQAIEHSMMVGIIGHDAAEGILQAPLTGTTRKATPPCEGVLNIKWPGARHSPRLEAAFSELEKFASGQLQRDGKILPVPLWKIAPKKTMDALKLPRGPVLTVHPLGGCPMGSAPDNGVVDEYGRVFDASTTGSGWFGSLVVLDGSILPGSLGVNPALTIAAVSFRASSYLRDTAWKWTAASGEPQRSVKPRPAYRQPEACLPSHSLTQAEVVERLTGPVTLLHDIDVVAEITLRYEPFALASLHTDLFRELKVSTQAGHIASELRLFLAKDWTDERLQFASDTYRATKAVYIADLSGSLQPLNRERSGSWQRKVRAFVPWALNRGARDAVSAFRNSNDQAGTTQGFWQKIRGALSLLCDAWKLASHAGEARTLIYKLQIGTVKKNPHDFAIAPGAVIGGHKRLTYTWRSNPLRQLTELTLTRFPAMASGKTALLKFDNRFVANQGIPLLRLVGQDNLVNGLVDVAALGAYLVRLMLRGHLWVFRKPDEGSAAPAKLLPGPVPGLPEPQAYLHQVDTSWLGNPVNFLLTRYQGKSADKLSGHLPPGHCPLLLVHGYSASGSTFTHPAIDLPMAKYFHQQGYDVWVVDLRTSAGMPTATYAWAFEDAALADLPVAIAKIKAITGAAKVDVFAHCIGAVMMSMALLTDKENLTDVTTYPGKGKDQLPRRYLQELEALPGSVRRLVLSQKGPALVYTDDNVLRAYLLRGLRRLVLPEKFQFRPQPGAGLTDQLMDRLLCALPYSDSEYRRENPLWPCKTRPWVGLRHRMDLLYGQDFNATAVPEHTLAAIQDLFGPLNLDTVAQAIHFAKNNCITNASGRNAFVSPERMHTRWGKIEKTLSIHGGDNRLADVETLNVMQDLMNNAGLRARFQTHCFEHMGHQDGLIGRNAIATYEVVDLFLKAKP